MTESFARNGRSRLPMTIQTKNLILAPHLPRHLRALLHGSEEFENVTGLRVADGIHDQLLSASSDFKTSVENARETDPWRFGFGVIHKVDNVLIGLCGFSPRPASAWRVALSFSHSPTYHVKPYPTPLPHT